MLEIEDWKKPNTTDVDYDYDRHDKSFYATDKSGNDLTVCYEGFDIMYIYVRNWK